MIFNHSRWISPVFAICRDFRLCLDSQPNDHQPNYLSWTFFLLSLDKKVNIWQRSSVVYHHINAITVKCCPHILTYLTAVANDTCVAHRETHTMTSPSFVNISHRNSSIIESTSKLFVPVGLHTFSGAQLKIWRISEKSNEVNWLLANRII